MKAFFSQNPSQPSEPQALSPRVGLSPGSFQYLLWHVASSTRALTCFTAEHWGGGCCQCWGEGRGSERTEHKIPSVLGWMAHFFSLKRAALNPICGSCQLCPRVPCGSKWLTSFYSGSGHGLCWPMLELTLYGWRWVKDGWIMTSAFKLDCIICLFVNTHEICSFLLGPLNNTFKAAQVKGTKQIVKFRNQITIM